MGEGQDWQCIPCPGLGGGDRAGYSCPNPGWGGAGGTLPGPGPGQGTPSPLWTDKQSENITLPRTETTENGNEFYYFLR